MGTKKILFNWLPPAFVRYPSPSFSILKSFLQKNGYEVDIKYWNIVFKKIQEEILRTSSLIIEDSAFTLLPFLNYIAHKCNDQQCINKISYKLLSINTQWVNFSYDFVKNKSLEYFKGIDDLLNIELSRLDIEKYSLFGVSSKLSQWIPANILVEKIKLIYPNIPVVIGGFGSKEEAYAIMKNFSFYDYAIWGEGEYPLLELLSTLDSNEKQKVPFLIYRDGNGIIASGNKKKAYFDLNELSPDYSDFFNQNDSEIEPAIAIEGSRGCHWQRCRFCYLNDGYRYRKKDVKTKILEIKNCINKYKVYRFIFLDNDIIGNDLEGFDHFLDELVKVREETNEFKIELGEIITKGINSNIVKKMSFAGFKAVQIGYESPSNELLKKIHKKNSFASNLLFIKWATCYKIRVNGLNVLTGLIEETQDDVIEGINNLKYLRFYLLKNYFEHNISTLAVACSSRYLKEMKEDEKKEWNRDTLSKLFPDGYFDFEDRFKLFQFASIDIINSELWGSFNVIENYYKNNMYEYELLKLDQKIFYREFFNKEMINEIELDDPLYITILSQSNHSVVSLNDLCKLNYKNEADIIKVVDSLYDEGLLYKSYSYDEIVSVINIELVL